MRRALTTLFLVLALCSGGCWDARDLANVAIATVASFDLPREEEKTKPGDRVLVAVLQPVLSEGRKELVRVIKSSGRTVGDARSDRANRSFRMVEINMVRTLLFGEALSGKGLSDTLDIVYRNPLISYHGELAVVEGRAVDVLELKTTGPPNIGERVGSLLMEIPDSNFVPLATLADFHCDQFGFGRNPVVPLISRSDVAGVQIRGLAIFKKDRMVGKVDKEAMKYLTLLRGEQARGVITFPLPDREEGEGTLMCTGHRKVEVKMDGEKAEISIEVKVTGDLVEVEEGFLNGSHEKINQVAEAAGEYIAANCREMVSRLQEEFMVDALNTGAIARAGYGRKIEKLDWDRVFSQAGIKVSARVKIRNYGAIR